MKKRILLWILVLGLLLGACSHPPAAETEPSPPVTTDETTEETTTAPEETTEETTVPEETEPPVVVELEEEWLDFLPGKEMTARQYFVYDCTTATFLTLSGRADEAVYPASVTKLFSAYVALQYIAPDKEVTAGSELTLIDPNSSRAGLQQGDTLTAEELVAAMLLPSGNDATYVLATAVGRLLAEDPELSPSAAVDRFVEQMNIHAKLLGMDDSHFVTPDGIHDSEHYVTMADLIIIGRLSLKDPIISKYCAMPSVSFDLTEERTLDLKNSNYLVHSDLKYYCTYAIGLKTGFTTPAGNCLLSAFRVGDRDLLIGVFGCPVPDDRFAETILLLANTYGLEIPEPEPTEPTPDTSDPEETEDPETNDPTDEGADPETTAPAASEPDTPADSGESNDSGENSDSGENADSGEIAA